MDDSWRLREQSGRGRRRCVLFALESYIYIENVESGLSEFRRQYNGEDVRDVRRENVLLYTIVALN